MITKVLDGFKSAFKEMDMKTKIIIGVVVLFLFIIIIAGACNKTTKKTVKIDDYKTIKTMMIESGKKYFKDEDLLPEVNFEEDVDVDTLIKEGYMEDITNYVSEGKSCDGLVLARNVENLFYYSAILDCGDDYYDLTLAEAIEFDNPIVTTGIGLYDNGKEKYFRGEAKTNYVKISNYLWRIIDVNETGDVKLVLNIIDTDNLALDKDYVWDNRYNNETKEYNGKNDFNISRIKDSLTSLATVDTIIDPLDRGKLLKRNLCIGSRIITDLLNDNSLECSKKSDNLYFFGMLTASEFLRASIDPDCINVLSPTCGNYNYLVSNRQRGWTITSLSNNTYQSFSYQSTGLKVNKAEDDIAIRPTIELHNLTVITDGIGTYKDPYTIE